MLGKLIKHELNATTRIFLPIYAVLLVISIINRFTFQLKIYQGSLPILSTFFIFLYVVSIILVLAATVIFMIVRFYKNLLTDEGYLMFTLPTRTYQLINSKLLVHLLWYFISILFVFGSVFIVLGTPDNLHFIKSAINEFYMEFKAIGAGREIIFFLQFLFLCLISQICNILSFYASIALGQLFKGHKIIGSFVAYIGIYTVLQLLMLLALGITAIFNLNQLDSLTPAAFNLAFLLIMILLSGATIVFYLITNNIFKKKLNLD